MGHYSLLLKDNRCVMIVGKGVQNIELNAVQLDFLIDRLVKMREQIVPPPPPKTRPPKGAEMTVNANGNFELPAMEEFQGGLLFPHTEPHAAYLSLQYASAHTPKWCEVRVLLRTAKKLTAYLQAMLADAHARGLF